MGNLESNLANGGTTAQDEHSSIQPFSWPPTNHDASLSPIQNLPSDVLHLTCEWMSTRSYIAFNRTNKRIWNVLQKNTRYHIRTPISYYFILDAPNWSLKEANDRIYVYDVPPSRSYFSHSHHSLGHWSLEENKRAVYTPNTQRRDHTLGLRCSIVLHSCKSLGKISSWYYELCDFSFLPRSVEEITVLEVGFTRTPAEYLSVPLSGRLSSFTHLHTLRFRCTGWLRLFDAQSGMRLPTSLTRVAISSAGMNEWYKLPKHTMILPATLTDLDICLAYISLPFERQPNSKSIYPPHLRRLINPGERKPLSEWFLPDSLTELSINEATNVKDWLSILDQTKCQLRIFHTGLRFCERLVNLAPFWPPTLTDLTLGRSDSHALSDLASLPPTLEMLTFQSLKQHSHFKGVAFPATLHTLIFDNIDQGSFSSSLFASLSYPPALTKLIFNISNRDFNYMDSVNLPSTLIELVFGEMYVFSPPILKQCTQLQSLRFGKHWGQTAPHWREVGLPPSLTELVLGDEYLGDLSFLRPLIRLQRLTIGAKYNRSIATTKMPASLLHLKLTPPRPQLLHQLPMTFYSSLTSDKLQWSRALDYVEFGDRWIARREVEQLIRDTLVNQKK